MSETYDLKYEISIPFLALDRSVVDDQLRIIRKYVSLPEDSVTLGLSLDFERLSQAGLSLVDRGDLPAEVASYWIAAALRLSAGNDDRLYPGCVLSMEDMRILEMGVFEISSCVFGDHSRNGALPVITIGYHRKAYSPVFPISASAVLFPVLDRLGVVFSGSPDVREALGDLLPPE